MRREAKHAKGVVCSRTSMLSGSGTMWPSCYLSTQEPQKLILFVMLLLPGKAGSLAFSRKHRPTAQCSQVLTWSQWTEQHCARLPEADPPAYALETQEPWLHHLSPNLATKALWFWYSSSTRINKSTSHSQSFLSSVQSLSRVQLFATPWTHCSMPGTPVLHHLLEFAQTLVISCGKTQKDFLSNISYRTFLSVRISEKVFSDF